MIFHVLLLLWISRFFFFPPPKQLEADGLCVFTAKVGVKTGTSGAGPMGPRIHMEILGLRALLALLAQDGHAQDLGVFGCQQRPWYNRVAV